MAGQAEKKQAKHAEQAIHKYLWAIYAVNALYIVWRVFLNWGSWGFKNILGFGLFSFISYFTYNSINNSLEVGVPFETYFDVYMVNLATQFLVTFSDWGWFLYLTVPGYVAWKILGFVRSYLFNSTAAELAEDDPAAKKRAEKKQRQAERPKYKVMR
eukprot:TRINITY_DN62581_c0_g1_i1.p1 TRINITY_DN62581_c0_g1~~TRINITY_DN62581_c0_g1_i1.p1  ORF type:complete len:180 (+),score=33.48 TRINITY_DN62581_c0_g1_i1:71-541(+)